MCSLSDCCLMPHIAPTFRYSHYADKLSDFGELDLFTGKEMDGRQSY